MGSILCFSIRSTRNIAIIELIDRVITSNYSPQTPAGVNHLHHTPSEVCHLPLIGNNLSQLLLSGKTLLQKQGSYCHQLDYRCFHRTQENHQLLAQLLKHEDSLDLRLGVCYEVKRCLGKHLLHN